MAYQLNVHAEIMEKFGVKVDVKIGCLVEKTEKNNIFNIFNNKTDV